MKTFTEEEISFVLHNFFRLKDNTRIFIVYPPALKHVDEIKQKITDAEKFAKDDKLRRAGIDLINTADSIVYQTKRMLDDAGEKLGD